MSIESYIPELWAAALLTNLEERHVYGNLVNHDYEGEIRNQGDTVNINILNPVTIKKYPENGIIDEAEQLTTTEIILEIDQADYYNFAINDIDKAQAAGDLMDKAAVNAVDGLITSSDSYIANIMANKAKLIVGDKAGVALTKDNVYQYLVGLKTVLDKAKVPKTGRWVVVPPEMEGLLLMNPLFVGTGSNASESRLSNGLIGHTLNFDVHVSNDVPVKAGKYQILASYDQSTTFAKQILKNEAYRPERAFSDAMKGLYVFGAQVVRENAIAKLEATF